MKYLDIDGICKNYPFTKGQMRNFLMTRDANGLDKCVLKIGKRLFFKIDLFEIWMDGHLEGKNE